MSRIIVVALLVVVLLVPSAVAAWPVECWYAAEKGGLFEWIACGVAMVAAGIWEETPGGYGYVPG